MVKDLIREIKSKLYQFIALTLITMLGVGFFVGIQVTGYDMRKTGDAYMDERSVLDYTLKHSLGIDQEMIDSLNDALETEVLGVVEEDMFARNEKFDDVVKVISYTDVTKNDLTLVSGRLPHEALEVVVDQIMVELYDLKIGDELNLMKNEIFTPSSVKIVGFVESSLYMNLERGQSLLGIGKVKGFIYTKDIPRLSDELIYTSVRIKDAKVDVEYTIGKIEENLSLERFNRLIEPEKEKLVDAQVELDKAKEAAKSEFEKADQEIVNATAKLEKSKTELEAGINQLSFIPITTGTLDERLEFARASYDKAIDNLNIVITSIEKQIAETSSPEIKEYLETQLNETLSELNTLSTEFEKGYAQIASGVKQYNEGIQKLEESKEKLAAENLSVNKKLSDAQAVIDKGYADIEAADHGLIYLQDRKDSIIGYREFYDDSNRIEKIGKVFPIIFFMVSILITLSTVTRLIEENRMEMGVYKALGYTSLRTSMKYVLFTGFSWFFGAILGLLFGFYFIPQIIYDAYRIMYQTPDMVTGIVVSYAYIPLIISFISSVGVTFIKSMRVANEKTSQLLRPVAPKGGQRILLEKIPFLWKRFSFLYKVSFRNLFRNKTRFLMTLLGIGGTTGLLIVGFGLTHSIYSIVDKQFNEIIQYDGLVYYDEDTFTKEAFDDYIPVYVSSSKHEGHEFSVYVTEDLKHLADFITFRDRKTNEVITYDPDSVIITEKLARLLNVKVGGSVDILIDDKPTSIKIDVITENYANHYIYTSKDKLESLSQKTYKENMILFDTSRTDLEQVSEEIFASDGVLAVQFLEEISKTYRDMMQSFDVVIWVVVGAALALEILVLTNLISMNMSERKKELATLKVLGFNKNELSSYILRENIILTFLSTIFGFVFGKVLHYFVVTQAEIDMLMFNYELKVSSYLYAFALTLILSILINYIMARRANKVNMSEALKTFDQ
ncbi:MAG: FtsX-like permease family protein [Erysipelothrix sp.]|nr:FtsX-like permease family protein [Erysipelothrix sp.]